MLYDRPYMRAPTFGPRAGTLKVLLISLIGAFVCQSVIDAFFGGLEALLEWMAFSGVALFEGKVWTLVSYAFLHEDALHLVFNMLGVFFIGRALEEELGSRSLAWLAVFGAGGGALAWFAFNVGERGVLVGASAVVTAFLTCFCLRRPEQPITLLLFFVLPCNLKPKWVLWGLLGIEVYGFLFIELKGAGGVAHSAHLGGMAAGLAYFLYLRSVTTGRVAKPQLQRPSWLKSKSVRKPVAPTGYTVNLINRETVQKEVDRILDKINERGFGSLTGEEKRILDKAKTLLEK